jgi:hypothetical protein
MRPLLDICHSLHSVSFARERFLPDPTQSLVPNSRSNQVIPNGACRLP